MVINPQEPQKLVVRLCEKPLVLYGFGGMGARIARWCDENGVDYIFADQDAVRKQNIANKQVISPEQLVERFSNANIVVASILYYGEILKKLLILGIPRENILSYQVFLPPQITWKDLEHATVWGAHTGRVKLISEWIPPTVCSVADYGAGKCSLRQLLPPSVSYYPIDYLKRSEDTIICDFDRDIFPDLQTEVSICTATLVFITHAKELLEHICTHTSRRIILSYVSLETFSDVEGRRACGYVSDLTSGQIQAILEKHGFYLQETRPDPANRIDTMHLYCRK